MEKFAAFSILAIVAVSLLAVTLTNFTSTGNSVYGIYPGAKLYGPGLKKAQEDAARYASVSEQDLFVERMQGKIAANRDKLYCKDNPDGPDPCEFDDQKQQWCCLAGGNTSEIIGGGPQLEAKPVEYVPLAIR